MNQVKLTCMCLVASACVLAGLLTVTLQQRGVSLESRAHADLLFNEGTFSFMTTRTQVGEEALFVLDSNSDKLLIYTLDLARKRLDLVGVEDLKRVFAIKAAGGGPAALPNAGERAPR